MRGAQAAIPFASSNVDGCPSGQWERAVNPSAKPTKVRILPHPPDSAIRGRLKTENGKVSGRILTGNNARGSGSGVEHRLAKARVASSNLVFRSRGRWNFNSSDGLVLYLFAPSYIFFPYSSPTVFKVSDLHIQYQGVYLGQDTEDLQWHKPH